MKNFNFKTLLLAIGLVVASVQPALARRIFFTAGVWNESSPTIFAHTWGSSDSDVKMTCTKNDLYYADIPDGNNKVIFVRDKSNASSIIWDGNDGFWNKTGDLDIPNDKDMYSITGWDGPSGSWSNSAMGFETADNGVKIWYNPDDVTNEINHGRDGVSTTILGNVTSLYLKEYFVKLYQNAENLNGTTTLHYWVYRTSAGRAGLTATTHNGGWGDWGSFGDDKYRKPKFGNKSLNDNLLSGLSSGKYTFEYYFSANGHNGEVIYCNNTSAQNFKVTFSIAPPVPTGFSASVANSGGGSGQATNNPFIIYYNQDVTLTVSASASSDSNEKLQFSFDNGSTWVDADDNNKATTTIKTSNTSSSVSKAIKYRYYNTVDNLEGTQSSTTIYYRSAEYTITLDKNGGTADGHCRVKYGATGIVSWNVNTDLDATKTGYKLTSSKYYTLSSASESTVMLSSHSGTFPANTTYTDADGKWKEASNNAKLYAQWTAQDYVVTLDYNNGSGTNVQKNVTYDSNKNLTQVTSNPLPTKTGQDFTGYWTNNDGTGTQLVGSNGYFLDEVSGYIKATKLWGYADNLTIYAGWANHVYSITYKDQGNKDFSGDWGTTVHPTTHTYNTATTLVDAPNKTGYTFDGWYSEATCENKVTELEATAYTTDITLYAKWNPTTTTVTLTANGGTGDDQQFTATYDQVIDASSITKHTRIGYDLRGYYAAQSGGSYILNRELQPNSSAVSGYIKGGGAWQYVGDAVTLYAQWQANKYTITLDNKGATTAGTERVEATFDGSFNPATITCPEKTDFVFGGYFVDDNTFATQLIGTDGKFIKGVATYTDANGNWIKDEAVTLYAKWTAASKPCKVNFGITDGTQIVARGTLTASVNDESFTSGNTITSGQTISLTYTNDNNNPAGVNAYTLTGYYQDITCQIPIQLSGTGNTQTYAVADDVNFYAKVTVNQYTFTPVVNPTEKGAISLVSGTQWVAGPSVPCEIQAVPVDGYSFNNWTTSGSQVVLVSNQEDATKTTVYLKNTNNTESVTANFSANTNTAYTVKHYKQNIDGTYPTEPTETDNLQGTTDTEVTPSTKEYEGFTAPSSQTVTIAGNGSTVVEYQYTRKSYNISYTAQATGWTYGTKPATAKFEENVSFVVNPTTGYSVAVTSSDATLNESAAPTYTFDMPAKDVQINVAATEILKPLTTSANESYMGTVEKTKTEIGVATTSTLTASSANRNYKFKQWNLTNCTITSGTVNNATITVKGDGVNNPSAEAVFEVAWLISGNTDISTGWDVSGVKMTVVSDGVFKYEFDATKVASDNGDYNFKVYNTTRTAYYANKEGDNGWWFKRDASSTTLEEGAQASTNMSLRSDMAGNYIFTLDCSTSRENPTLTVTFPTSTTYDVDVYYDGVTKTTVEGGSFTKQITAQVPESMQFDHWEVEGETTHVNITNTTSQTTTFTASGTGAIIRAKFNTNNRIYLKGGSNFSDAYMNFYSSNYWDSNNKGTGNKGSECVAKNWKMNKIKNTDIFWLDISSAPNTWKDYFSFVNKGDESDNFYMCNVVYRNDMKDALPFYVPRNGYANEHHNSSQYFNEGIWMKYNDTYSGYKLHIIETGSSENDYEFNAETPGGYEFKTTVSLKTGVTYKFKIVNENNTWYGASGQTMTATSCTNWKMHLDNDDCQITTSEAGNYTFILNLGSGEVIVSVEYPLSANDYHVVAKKDSEDKWVGDLIKHSNVAKNDTTSFFNNNYTYQLQQYNGSGWSDVTGQIVTPPDSAKQGVITLIVTQDGSGQAILAYEGIYTGNYYIRTDGVDGGWGDYENNSDNKMDNYGSSIQADPEYQYDVYKAKWITSGKNVKFRVANDYSKAISAELTGDAVIGNDKETLPQSANVRFMWNSTTNQLKRAYLSGSSNPSDRYLILEGDAKMFDKDGAPLNITGLNANELNFEDKNNWVYQADIKAKPGCKVKLTAKYNGKVQYFIGKEGDGDDSRRTIIAGDESDTPYSLRAVYDFKTNRLVVGWMPSGTITSSIELGSDMLIERTEQGDASQIIFGGAEPSSLSISEIQHIYGVLKLTKESMLEATATTYGKCIYWISFPFDVKVSEIFGVEKYGEVWVISNYRGDLRAQKGWFKEDTPTFWEYLKPTDIMKANVGYTLNLDPDYFNKESSEPWKSGAEEVAWYFPSMQENIGVVSLAQKDTTLPAQHCTIDREFNAGTDDVPRMVNHKFTDSNWRVIGVPAFQNLQAPTMTPTEGVDDNVFGLTGFYEWDPEHNTYTAQSTSEYTFKATGAYMVQYEGKITWSNASAITTKNSAPWHASADSKSYSIKLEFGNEAYTDQTFVTLTEKASTDFVLNEDMMKLDNAGYPNIYSFAGNYNVAYNETKMDNQTVTLGVSAPKAETYTFAMPNQFSGTAKLIDLVEGITTDLNISDYSVDLSKGTYNDRFQLLLEVEAKAPTSVEATGDRIQATGKTTKLLRNGNIYLINAGRVYNVLGVEE